MKIKVANASRRRAHDSSHRVAAARATALAPGYARRRAAPIKLKRILVPLDFSATARRALDYALALAEEFEAKTFLLHVIQPVLVPGAAGFAYAPLDTSERTATAHDKLRDLATQRLPPNLLAKTLVSVGRPSDEIVKAARKFRADLIVITTHGHTGLKHVLLGSTAEAVVRHAPCPVLTVHRY
jgi:nucleotide-binding universal stress UspA family protein